MCNTEQGFSLPELIAVIAIIAILGVSAMAKWSGSSINLAAQADKVASDIRYIQGFSTSHGQRYRINFSATRYGFTNLAGTTPLAHPVTNAAEVELEQGTSLASTVSFIAFSGVGAPYVTATLPGTALTTDAIITLTADGKTRTVRVSPETGRVLMQ